MPGRGARARRDQAKQAQRQAGLDNGGAPFRDEANGGGHYNPAPYQPQHGGRPMPRPTKAPRLALGNGDYAAHPSSHWGRPGYPPPPHSYAPPQSYAPPPPQRNLAIERQRNLAEEVNRLRHEYGFLVNEAWMRYVSSYGGGNYEPFHHDAKFLEEFVREARSAINANSSLVNEVKRLQSSSVHASEAWKRMCYEEGGGEYDPKKHEAWFLENFLDHPDVRSEAHEDDISRLEQLAQSSGKVGKNARKKLKRLGFNPPHRPGGGIDPTAAASTGDLRLDVSDLPLEAIEADLHEHFSQYGEIVEVQLKRTLSANFGIVTLAGIDEVDADGVIEDDHEILGTPVKVKRLLQNHRQQPVATQETSRKTSADEDGLHHKRPAVQFNSREDKLSKLSKKQRRKLKRHNLTIGQASRPTCPAENGGKPLNKHQRMKLSGAARRKHRRKMDHITENEQKRMKGKGLETDRVQLTDNVQEFGDDNDGGEDALTRALREQVQAADKQS